MSPCRRVAMSLKHSTDKIRTKKHRRKFAKTAANPYDHSTSEKVYKNTPPTLVRTHRTTQPNQARGFFFSRRTPLSNHTPSQNRRVQIPLRHEFTFLKSFGGVQLVAPTQNTRGIGR